MHSDHDGQHDGHHDEQHGNESQLRKEAEISFPFVSYISFFWCTMITTTANHIIQHPPLLEGYEINIMEDTEMIYFYHSDTRTSVAKYPTFRLSEVKIWTNDIRGEPLRNELYGQPPLPNKVPATSFTGYVYC